MDEEIMTGAEGEMPEAPKEETSPLADVTEAVAKAEGEITSGAKTKDEAIDELIATLQGMKEGGAENIMGGMGGGDFKLPEPEEE
jgi:hypothetical protein